MSMLVSVILPTYNRSSTLIAAVNSVLTQSYRDLELIIVDDGSKENIRDLVGSIPDERVRYIAHERNQGAAAARNTGLRHARGNYIAFQDSDDLWLPGKLQRQMMLLTTRPDVGAVIGAKILYGRDNGLRYGPGKVGYAPAPAGILRPLDDQIGRLLIENRISLQNGLFAANCLPDMCWFDPCAKANEDWDFAIRLVQHIRIYEDIEPVVLGFVSPDSISRNKRREAIGLLRIIKKNRNLLADRHEPLSLMLINLGRYFYGAGKTRRAARFLMAGLQAYPRNWLVVAASILRKIRLPRRGAARPRLDIYAS